MTPLAAFILESDPHRRSPIAAARPRENEADDENEEGEAERKAGHLLKVTIQAALAPIPAVMAPAMHCARGAIARGAHCGGV